MALDPKTAATIAKIAIQAALDDEKRNRIIFISLAPIISVLLILAFITYILTSPIRAITSIFHGNELSQINTIRSYYGYEQIIDTEDSSFKDSSNTNSSGITFDNGVVKVCYFNQADVRWKDKPYGKIIMHKIKQA